MQYVSSQRKPCKFTHLPISQSCRYLRKGHLVSAIHCTSCRYELSLYRIENLIGKLGSSPNPPVPGLPSAMAFSDLFQEFISSDTDKFKWMYKSLQSKLLLFFKLSTHSYQTLSQKRPSDHQFKPYVLGTSKHRQLRPPTELYRLFTACNQYEQNNP